MEEGGRRTDEAGQLTQPGGKELGRLSVQTDCGNVDLFFSHSQVLTLVTMVTS